MTYFLTMRKFYRTQSSHSGYRSEAIYLIVMTVSTEDEFREAAKETLIKYLEYFPDELARQSAFMHHLSNPLLDLRLRSTIPEGHICASGILLLPGSKLLMLHHKTLNMWVVPGGHYDLTDGAVSNAAIRETIEETGLTIPVQLHPWHLKHGIPLDIDTHPIPLNEKKNEGAHQHFDFRYLLTVAQPEQVISQLTLDANEVTDFAEMPLSEVDTHSSIGPAIVKLRSLPELNA